MNPAMLKLMGLHDARGNQGIYARGSNVYNGVGSTPNPMGLNQASAAQRLLMMRQKFQGGIPSA